MEVNTPGVHLLTNTLFAGSWMPITHLTTQTPRERCEPNAAFGDIRRFTENSSRSRYSPRRVNQRSGCLRWDGGCSQPCLYRMAPTCRNGVLNHMATPIHVCAWGSWAFSKQSISLPLVIKKVLHLSFSPTPVNVCCCVSCRNFAYYLWFCVISIHKFTWSVCLIGIWFVVGWRHSLRCIHQCVGEC